MMRPRAFITPSAHAVTFAPVTGNLQQAYIRVLMGIVAHEGGGAILRAAINHDYFGGPLPAPNGI
jgi:hypothetical protein